MAMDALNAGIDTTGNTATFMFYHLARHPEKQETLYEEIVNTIGKDGNMTAATLGKMKYLKACQQESQRMLPVAFGSARKTQEDMVLGGYEVPAGTSVLRWGHISSNSKENFTNPELFLPERWIRGHPHHHNADPYSNLPFGHGPRACVGQRFAKLELYLVLAKMIQRFRLEYHGGEVDVKTGFFGSPNIDVVLKIT